MDLGMDFEVTMRLVFGDKAYHIAGQNFDTKARSQWLRRWVKALLRDAMRIDTTARHKQRIGHALERVAKSIDRSSEPTWGLVFALLRLVSILFGRDFVKGARCHTPVYFQTSDQRVTVDILTGGDAMQDYYDLKDAISVRAEVVKSLKEQGYDDFKIGLVLNTSEYEVKKLLRELK